MGHTLGTGDKVIGIEVVGIHHGLIFRDSRVEQIAILYSTSFIML